MSGSISIQTQPAPRGFSSAREKKKVIKFARGLCGAAPSARRTTGGVSHPTSLRRDHWLWSTTQPFFFYSNIGSKGSVWFLFCTGVSEQRTFQATSEQRSLNIWRRLFKHQTGLKIHICLWLMCGSSLCIGLILEKHSGATVITLCYIHMQCWIKKNINEQNEMSDKIYLQMNY